MYFIAITFIIEILWILIVLIFCRRNICRFLLPGGLIPVIISFFFHTSGILAPLFLAILFLLSGGVICIIHRVTEEQSQYFQNEKIVLNQKKEKISVELKQTEEKNRELETDAETDEAIYKFTKEMDAVLKVEPMLNVVAGMLHKCFIYTDGILVLFEGKGDELSTKIFYDLKEAKLVSNSSAAVIDSLLIEKIQKEKKAFSITREPELASAVEGLDSLIHIEWIVPLIFQKELIGILIVKNNAFRFVDDDRFSVSQNREMTKLSTFSHLIASGIRKSQLYEKLDELSIRDGLTGLYNRRKLNEKLSDEFSRLGLDEKHGHLGFLMIDIDLFKNVNDTYGHQAGDSILRQVSKILLDAIRNVDIAARYGGEEFSIILPETDSEGSMIIAERIRKKIEETVFRHDEFAIPVTVSIGVSEYPVFSQTKEELLKSSDDALYEAKDSGRNRVCLAKKQE